MNLRTLLPASDFHHILEAAGIVTAHDILFTHESHIYQRVTPEQLPPSTLSGLKAQVAQLVSAPATRGDKLFACAEERENVREACECGVIELDALLAGFGAHGIIEIAGGKKSGKTGLVLQIVIRHLAQNTKGSVFWLDTGGEFAVERAAEILKLNPGPGSHTALDRMCISTCFDVAAAHQVLDDLRVSLAEVDSCRTRFIVVDPITPLFAPILSATSSQGHAIMTTFMRQIASLARTYFLTAIVTNTSVQSLPQNPYSAFSTTIAKPALGPSFTFLTDETLWLANTHDIMTEWERMRIAEENGLSVFVAEVFRSHSKLSKTWCAFTIRNGVSFERFTQFDE